MIAKEQSFTFMKADCFYEIPFFQRNYVWSYDNWEEMLNTLLDTARCSFLGSIILKQISTRAGETARFSIVDGQQRLTTLSILLRACYDTLLNSEKEYPKQAKDGFKTALNTQLFVVVDKFIGTTQVKIQHSHIDRPNFEKIINGDCTSKENLNKIILRDEAQNDPKNLVETESKILLCYKYFRKQLEGKIDETERIWTVLTQDNVKFLVNIDLLPDENEQTIFDAVNSSGIRLTSSDTIKNALFQKYIELCKKDVSHDIAEKEAIALYDSTWKVAFLESEEDAAYWATQHQSGRLYRDNIEILLHCVAVIEGFFDPDESKMSELAQCYKDYISKLDKLSLKQFIEKIKAYADLYKEKIETNESSVLYSYENYLTRLTLVLEVLEVSTFHPYLLKVLYDNKGSDDDTAQKTSCEALERYVILHAICNASTKNYNKECVQLIGGESIEKLLSADADINAARFNQGLKYICSNKNATLLLFWVELYRRYKDSKTDLKELKYTYTLEHIMPQKWGEYWGVNTLPVLDENGQAVIDSNIASAIRAAAVYEIGNMTLLNSKLNTSLRNYTFDRKINGEGRKKGMKKLADCFITREILDKSTWNEKEINARTTEIIKDIKEIWQIKV